MKLKILKNIQENIEIFHTDIFLLGKIQGCTLAEIKEFDRFYNYQIPNIIKELLFLGGYNFFEFYFELEYVTGFKLWTRLKNHSFQTSSYLGIPLNVISFNTKNRIYLVACQGVFLYIPLDEGNNPPVYELIYYDEIIISVKYNSILELIDLIIQEQKKKYLLFKERERLGIDEFTLELKKELENKELFTNSNKLPF